MIQQSLPKLSSHSENLHVVLQLICLLVNVVLFIADHLYQRLSKNKGRYIVSFANIEKADFNFIEHFIPVLSIQQLERHVG